MNKLKNQNGQLSIFLGISLLVVISFMAFIVNVGMFVKAKINLQNAVDAAAWSGAAVQSRQLSNISYLNWEMRNTYKEWMFKYYVLGQMGLTSLKRSRLEGKERVNFRLIPYSGKAVNDDYDKFNIPSTCIHFGSSKNICTIFAIPGLPRFETNGLPSLSNTTNAFTNSLVKDKARNCSTRANLNMGAAMVWAYGMGKNLFTDMPSVAADRVGAWPQAFELALRMRNLEAVVNRPPVSGPLCTGNSDVPGCQTIETLPTVLQNYNERPVKAFVAAFRNLSGGASKENIEEDSDDQFVKSFSLTELAPNAFTPDDNTLSRFLIPSSSNARTKYYLDLQASPLNLVAFYTHFIAKGATQGGPLDGITDTTSEGGCPSAKVAIPVPGYLFGFVKNPEVVTYYAVKGSAKYVGMFYPFADRTGVELTAFAAAKPFGGRVGPRLFEIKSGGKSIYSREDAQKRSAPYVSYLTTKDTAYEKGDPIPSSNNFWVSQEAQPIGGTPLGGEQVRFVIPNLLYQFNDFSKIVQDQAGTQVKRMSRIEPAPNKASWETPIEILGLYSTDQYLPFRENLPDLQGAAITAEQINLAIEKVRRPTNYEVLNYMIPTLEEDPASPSKNFDALPLVNSTTNSTTGTKKYYIFAPLFGPQTLFQNAETIKAIATEYIANNNEAINTYVEALRDTAKRILEEGKSTTGGDLNDAANAIYLSPNGGNTHTSCSGDNPSMAQKFYQFFKGTGTACGGIVPLDQSITEYIFNENSRTSDPEHPYQNFYVSTYYKPDASNSLMKNMSNSQMMTAYMPGKRQGVEQNGVFNHPFLQRTIVMRRNYYSTKFVAVKAVAEDGGVGYASKEPIYSEDVGPNVPNTVEFKYPSDLLDNQVKNMLEAGQISDYLESKYTH